MITFKEYCKTIREDWGKTSPIPKEVYTDVKWEDNFHWIDLGLPSGTLWADADLVNPDDSKGFWTWDGIMDSEYAPFVPTQEQMQELYDDGTWEWDSKTGMVFKGKYGKSITFFPEGHRENGAIYEADFVGNYWSSTYFGYNCAYSLTFDSGYANPSNLGYRQYGFLVRLVRSANK